MKLENGRVRCLACGHRCLVPPGREGICRVRFNEDGVLKVPFGYVAALHVDPVEKKPFFHALPGARALSFGMLGCDLHCGYCQNWLTSQALRDEQAIAPAEEVTPEDIVRLAQRSGARIVTSTYNEPLITSEWAVAVFRLAKAEGLLCSYVSNGNGTEEVLDYLRPWVVALQGRPQGLPRPALPRARRHPRARDVDDPRSAREGLLGRGRDARRARAATTRTRSCATSRASSSRSRRTSRGTSPPSTRTTRWTTAAPTSVRSLLRAAEIGREEGLRFVYAGNLPGAVRNLENTYCPGCGALLVERAGFRVLRNAIGGDGALPGLPAGDPRRLGLSRRARRAPRRTKGLAPERTRPSWNGGRPGYLIFASASRSARR